MIYFKASSKRRINKPTNLLKHNNNMNYFNTQLNKNTYIFIPQMTVQNFH